MTLAESPIRELQAEDLSATIERLRQTVITGRTDLAWRKRQLHRLKDLLTERKEDIAHALAEDLGKARSESILSEIAVVVAEIDDLIRQLSRFARRQRVRLPLILQPGKAWTKAEPYGVVLIVAPWNYPVNLTLAPLAGALAAGNTAVVKPSELAPETSALLARLLPQYLADDVITVVEGGKEVSEQLLQERFDLIFFTGSEKVGRIVATAAAQHLTPVVLELGGKSPAWVDEKVDLSAAARRIIWAKLMNIGQTCVAPDYVLCTENVADRLQPLLEQAVRDLYGEDLQKSKDYGRAISVEAANRLRKMAGLGPAPADDPKYVPFTVLRGAAAEPAMQEEIFGPILPIVVVEGPDPVGAALARIRAKGKPLALYVFADSSSVRRRFEEQTSSGALGFGIALAHLAVPSLPFGGVGSSGHGNYHGRWSLDTFSHRKAVLSKPLRPDTTAVAYPPFGKGAEFLERLQLKVPLWKGRRE